LDDTPTYKRENAKLFQQKLETAGIDTVMAML